MNLDDHYHICFLNTIKSKRETKMKQLSYLLFLLAGLWLAGCDDSSDASLIPEIMPTEQGSDTYVMVLLSILSPRLLPVVIMRLLLSVVNRSKGLPPFQLPMLSAKMPK